MFSSPPFHLLVSFSYYAFGFFLNALDFWDNIWWWFPWFSVFLWVLSFSTLVGAYFPACDFELINLVGSPPLSWPSCHPSTSSAPSLPVANSTGNYNTNIYKRVLPPEEQQKKTTNLGRNPEVGTGGGGSGPEARSEPIPTTSSSTSYPAVLRTERGGHNASTRAKVPPPVPPRTPKRIGTAEGLGPSKGPTLTKDNNTPLAWIFV